MHALVLAPLLAGLPRVQPEPRAIDVAGPPAPATVAAARAWLAGQPGVGAAVEIRGRRIELPHGGWLLLLRQTVAGRPVAGSRLALRAGPDGRLRQVVGSLLEDRPVPTGRGDAGALWWPTPAGLVAARVDVVGTERRWVEAATGRILGREPDVDEVVVFVRGWPHDPVTSPAPVDFEVDLADVEGVVRVESGLFRVWQCAWDAQAQACAPVLDPIATLPQGFPTALPPLDDAAGHADPTDPYAPLQFIQLADRFQADLVEWGWDPFAWDELDCSWQMVDDPIDCRVVVYTNVLAQDAQGVMPYAGAFYRRKGEIWLGQGEHADTAYDGDIVRHEIGHHVTWSFGSPEPTDAGDDGARLYTDVSALNEASSDFLARAAGPNDRIYDYFSTVEPGVYVDERIRDVSIPFRCPQNVVGEVHMDGRIWVSAVVDAMVELTDLGLADTDAFAATYLGALAAIRQIPREHPVHLPQARAILLDEIELSFGAPAGAHAAEIFDERGVGTCDYVVDLRHEPSVAGGDPQDPLDVRFMVVPSHATAVDPQTVAEHPKAPPLQHRIDLAADEGGVELRFRRALWRPPRPVDEVDLSVEVLVRQGQPVGFSRDPASGLTEHEADLSFASVREGEHERVRVEGLVPGETYFLAVVSQSTLDGDLHVLEDMEWTLLPAGGGGDDGGEIGSGETGDPEHAGSGGGCGCVFAHPPPAGAAVWVLGWALAARRARVRSARAGQPRAPGL